MRFLPKLNNNRSAAMLITCNLKCENPSAQTQKLMLALSPGETHSKAAYGTSKVRVPLQKKNKKMAASI